MPDDGDLITNTIRGTLPVGSYVLTETVPAGWNTAVDIHCQGNSRPAGAGDNVLFVDVGPGDDVVCTFGNRKLATLTVVKKTVGGDGAFGFNFYDLGFLSDVFTLTTQSGTAQRVLSDLTTQGFEIEENVPAGWTLTDAQCSGVTNDDWVRDGNSLKPFLSPGDNATCTFTNTKSVNLTIVKKTVGGDATFDFGSTPNSDFDIPVFSLTTQGGTAQQTLSDLHPGFYELSETMPQGWAWSNAVCDADYFFDGSLVQLFDLAPGDDVTCTCLLYTSPSPRD